MNNRAEYVYVYSEEMFENNHSEIRIEVCANIGKAHFLMEEKIKEVKRTIVGSKFTEQDFRQGDETKTPFEYTLFGYDLPNQSICYLKIKIELKYILD